jgi:hypothetical protein
VNSEITSEIVKRGENIAVNPINTRFPVFSENSEDNDFSLLSPKMEQDFTNPSVVIDFGNGEKGIADLQKGIGEGTSDGLPTVALCKKRLGTLESKKRNGAVSEATYQKGIIFWNDQLEKAKSRGVGNGNN